MWKLTYANIETNEVFFTREFRFAGQAAAVVESDFPNAIRIDGSPNAILLQDGSVMIECLLSA